ncbi:MAG TPA: hypothetical protein VGD65_12040 [Chryseosolibacter sp.]
MKTFTLKSLAGSLSVIMLTSVLLSFTKNPGGDSFTIYLNDKLLVQQYVHMKEKTKTISLHQATANDVLRIHYSHCGKMGISRNLFIKDSENKIVKTWKFEDSADGDKGSMTVRAGELADVQKRNAGKKLSLVYTAEQLPDGITLAMITTSGNAEASIR